MQARHPAARLEARRAWARLPGGQSCGLLCVAYVHVPGSVDHRRSLHGIYRGHHITGEKESNDFPENCWYPYWIIYCVDKMIESRCRAM